MSRPRFVVRHVGDSWAEHVAGSYVKLGGGITRDLSEAQVIGWKNHSRWTYYAGTYELIPVTIALDLGQDAASIPAPYKCPINFPGCVSNCGSYGGCGG